MTQHERTLSTIRRGCVFVAIAAASALVACKKAEPLDSTRLIASLDSTRGMNAAFIAIKGLSKEQLAAWRKKETTDPSWGSTFRMFVSGNASAPVAVRYTVSESGIELHPQFPLDRGRKYDVLIIPPVVEGAAQQRSAGTVTTIQAPGLQIPPTTVVARLLPDLDSLPENQLRLYVEFSAPMGRDGGLPFVHLREVGGDSVGNAFLPVDGNFWNDDKTRYTMFLDPGRVKRGILPNEQMGRPLVAGKRYEVHVDSTWRDGMGVFLVKSFSRAFVATGAESRPITLAEWKVSAPRVNTRDPLVVKFPRALDYGLLKRALGVESTAGVGIPGDVTIDGTQREWRFTPGSQWAAGAHQLIVLSILEDLAGNRVNRAFEADRFDVADSTSTVPRFTIPFVVK